MGQKSSRLLMLSKEEITFPLVTIFVFILSIPIGLHYTEGDQFHYRAVYDAVSSLSFIEGYLHYNVSLSSYEYVHYSLIWVFSRFLEKDVFIALTNSVLVYLLLINLAKLRVFYLISVVLVLSNFYLFVLYFAAERLKFGVIFFLLSFYYIERVKLFYPLALISVSSHAQFLILYSGFAITALKKPFLRFCTLGLISKKIFLLLALFIIVTFLLKEQVISKFIAYYDTFNIIELWKMFVFFALSMWYAKSRRGHVILFFIPLFLASGLFGSERVNMFGFFVFMYFALQVNRGLNIGVLATSLYFGLQTFFFLKNIVLYGDGFYAGL